ncbi:MAG: hypothetical protein ABR860_03035 [Terracidiphilus sp.]|jgi:hypothetical protein
MNFTIHGVQIDSSVGPRIQLSVDYMQGPGRAADYVTFDSLDSLTVSMRSVRVDEERISKMQNDLATRKTFSLPDVYLTDQDLAKLGLFVLGRQRFSAISAVEGLQLDSEGTERVERTRGLPSEERRAETIHAFAQSRNRE